uniref:CCHC-type domain-containing protein n=2 Tax=Caenorhabditis japonica TaxID=281687 RepID=A0A8R1DZ80_CAEJA
MDDIAQPPIVSHAAGQMFSDFVVPSSPRLNTASGFPIRRFVEIDIVMEHQDTEPFVIHTAAAARISVSTSVTGVHLSTLKKAIVADFTLRDASFVKLKDTVGQLQDAGKDRSDVAVQLDDIRAALSNAEVYYGQLVNRINDLEKQVSNSPAALANGPRKGTTTQEGGENGQGNFTRSSNHIADPREDSSLSNISKSHSLSEQADVFKSADALDISDVSGIASQAGAGPESGDELSGDVLNVSGMDTIPAPVIGVLGIKHALPLKPFTGNISDNYPQFIRTFGDYLDASCDDNVTENQKIKGFLTFLTGRARNKAEEVMKKKDIKSLKELQDELATVFDNDILSDHREEVLRNCKQAQDETVDQFYQRIESLENLINSGKTNPETVQRIALQAFVNGLGWHIRFNVKNKRPRTMDAAFQEAIFQETLHKEQVGSQVFSPLALAYLANYTNGAQTSGQDRQNRPQPDSTRFRGECFYCRKLGHFAKDCKKKQRDQGSRRTVNYRPKDPVANHRQWTPKPAVQTNAVHTGMPTYEDLARRLETKDAQIEQLCAKLSEMQGDDYESTFDSKVCSLTWPGSSNIPKQATQAAHGEYFTAHVPIRANNIPDSALIDTGANLTVASADTCKMLGIQQLQKSRAPHAIGLGGNAVKMAGSATVTFRIGSNTMDHVVHFTPGKCIPEEGRPYSFIFGNDLLAKLPPFFINYKEAVFHVGDDVLPMGRKVGNMKLTRNFQVQVCSDTVIPAGTEALVKCSISPIPKKEENLVLMVDSQLLTKEDLFVSPAVFDSNNVLLRIGNPTIEDKQLNANQTAALAERITSQGIQKAELQALLDEFADTFSKNAYDLGSSKTEPVHIYTTTETPVRGRSYRVPVKFQAELQKHINSLLWSERITESNTPWTSPIVLVKKKNGSMRVCLDF